MDIGGEIRKLIFNGMTDVQISKHLRSKYDKSRGYGVKVIQRLRKEAKIPNSKSRVVKAVMRQNVSQLVHDAGPAYGRKMIAGLAKSQGLDYSARSIQTAVRKLFPV